MTIGWIIFVVLVGLLWFGITIYLFLTEDAKFGIVGLLITIIIVGAMVGGELRYYNSTASGARALKDQKSNLNNGTNREITITAEDGREIYHYIGKCDIETNDKYILFEDESGNRQMIYWGVTDTIIISEID